MGRSGKRRAGTGRGNEPDREFTKFKLLCFSAKTIAGKQIVAAVTIKRIKNDLYLLS
jgi:hypothetical protein